MKVVLDPGHGGTDPGACGNGLHESDITLQIARLIAECLTDHDDMQVKLTRDSDSTLTLTQRSEISNNEKASLFVSIHCNSSASATAHGFEVFHFPGSRQGKAFADIVHESLRPLYPQNDDRGVKEENFAVLRHTNAPAILIEISFISNPIEAKKMADPNWQLTIAKTISSGINRMKK